MTGRQKACVARKRATDLLKSSKEMNIDAHSTSASSTAMVKWGSRVDICDRLFAFSPKEETRARGVALANVIGLCCGVCKSQLDVYFLSW